MYLTVVECKNAKGISCVVRMRLDNFIKAIRSKRLQEPFNISARETSECSTTKAHILDHYRPFDNIHCSKNFRSSHLFRGYGLVLR